MKYPPSVNVLRAVAAGKVGWTTALGEWIDNAFDRSATRVFISFERDTVTVQDDGEGTATPHKIVQLGEHDPTVGLGEFGMGGTESLLWAGGERSDVAIDTVNRGVYRTLKMNWLHYAQSDWELPDPHERHAKPGEIGTIIRVSPLRAKLPYDMGKLCDELGFLYSHAIRRDNKQITIKGPGIKERPRVVPAWLPPEFEPQAPTIHTVVQIGNREADVFAGVVKNGVKNLKSGLTYWYKFRVILPASSRGCGDFNIGRVCGFVELRGGWKSVLTRNKNGIVVGDDALFAAVEQAIRPVLEAAERAGSVLGLRDLNTRLETRVGAMIRATKDAKAKRERGETQGTVTPTGSTKRHKRAKTEQPGSTFPGTRNGRGIKVGHEHLGNTKVGEAKPPNVTLNLDNPFVAEAVKNNRDDTLVVLIAVLIGDWEVSASPTGDRYLRGTEPQDIPETVGRILAGEPVLDGKPALKLASVAG
jgi:hypothetical protein